MMRLAMSRRCAGLALSLVMLAGSGCSAMKLVDVSPWEKGKLARPEMTFEGNPLEAAYQEHIYASKESASGGAGVGGGGCGCN
jgi:hypothetical protein